MELSEFAFGTASVGSRIGYADFVRLADLARQAGITRFDSAPQYGRGLAQVYIERYLNARPDAGGKVSSKLGRLPIADPKSILVVLRQGEWRHAMRLSAIPRQHAADFSAENLSRSLAYTRDSLDLGRVETLFLHSSPQPVLGAGAAQGIQRLCGDRFRPGVAEPCDADLHWLLQNEPNGWSIQVSAQTLLCNRDVQTFPGVVWVNSIIRFTRRESISLPETMRRLRSARCRDLVFVVGFNHARLFDDFVAL